MAFIPVPDAAEAVFNYTINGKPTANVVGFQYTGAYDQTAIDLLAEVLDLAVDAYLIPLMQTSVNYNNVLVRGLTSAVDLTATNGTSAASGTASAPNITQQASYVITLGTGFTGRSARGRWYAQPYGGANITSSRAVSSGFANNLVDAIADMFVDAATAGWDAIIISRQTGGAPRTTGVPYLITDIIAGALNIDTQRRRVGK